MDKWLYRLSLALAILGLLVSIYMTIFKLTENPNMCLGNGGCSTVNNSKYSMIYGIPVAVVGMGGYADLMGTVNRPLFSIVGPLLSLSVAILISEWPSSKPQA